MVVITESEIAKALEDILKEIEETPETKIDSLFEIASILLTTGLCKNSTAFKLLADHIISIPARLKPILFLPYRMFGTTGELQEKYGKLAESSKNELYSIIRDSINVISGEEIDEIKALELTNRARKLLLSLPRFEE